MNKKLLNQIELALANCKLIKTQQTTILKENLQQLRKQIRAEEILSSKDIQFYFEYLEQKTESVVLNQYLATLLHFLYAYSQIDNTLQK
jgi:hypothetical protein